MPRTFSVFFIALALSVAGCVGTTDEGDEAWPSKSDAEVFGSDSDLDYGLPPVLPKAADVSGSASAPSSPAPVPAVAPAATTAPAPRRVVGAADHPAPPPVGFISTWDEGEEVLPETLDTPPVPDTDGGETVMEEEFVVGSDPTPAEAVAPPSAVGDHGAPLGWQNPYSRGRARACCCPSHYFEFGPEVLPGIGGGFNFGWRFHRGRNVTWAAEIGASYQDLWEEFIGEGLTSKYWAIRLGLKAEFGDCNCRLRPFIKGGVTLFELAQPRASFPSDPNFSGQDDLGDLINFDKEGSNFGVYAAIGFDWKINRSWTIGPEVGYFLGENLSRGGDVNRAPYVRLNISYNF